MVKTLKNNKGTMLPMMGFIIIILGASFGSVYVVGQLHNDIRGRAKFQRVALETFNTLNEFELFYEKMVRLAFEEILISRYEHIDNVCPADIPPEQEGLVKGMIASSIDEWAGYYKVYKENKIPLLNLEGDESGELDLIVNRYESLSVSSDYVANNEIEVYFDEDNNEYFVHEINADLEFSGTTGQYLYIEVKGINSNGAVVCQYSEGIALPEDYTVSVSFFCDQLIQKVSAKESAATDSLKKLTVSTDLYGMGYIQIQGHASEPLKALKESMYASAPSYFKETAPARIDVKPDFNVDYLKIMDSEGDEVNEIELGETLTVESRYRNTGCAKSSASYHIEVISPDGSSGIIAEGDEGPYLYDSVYLTESWTPTMAGIYEVKSIVDPDEKVAEEDETNNVITKTIEVISVCSPEIYTWHDLNEIRNCLSDDFTLMNDLDENTDGYDDYAGSSADGGKGWNPIGTDNNRFTGTFYGQGYTISGLYINRPDESYVGLFAAINGVVQNVGLEDVDVTGGYERTGGLVGRNSGTISNSYVTGSVVGADWEVGGLVGGNWGTVSNSYSTGSVSGSSNRVGGLIGQISGSSVISNSYSTASVSGSGIAVGGLIGNIFDGSVSNSYSTGSVSGGGTLGGLVGYNAAGTVSNSYWNTETSGQTTSAGGEGKTTAEMRVISTFSDAGWDINTYADDLLNDGYPFFSWQVDDLNPIWYISESCLGSGLGSLQNTGFNTDINYWDFYGAVGSRCPNGDSPVFSWSSEHGGTAYVTTSGGYPDCPNADDGNNFRVYQEILSTDITGASSAELSFDFLLDSNNYDGVNIFAYIYYMGTDGNCYTAIKGHGNVQEGGWQTHSVDLKTGFDPPIKYIGAVGVTPDWDVWESEWYFDNIILTIT